MMKPFSTVVLVLAVVASGHAWGTEGHQAIASAAQGQLHPTALAAISSILGPGIKLQDVAVWADEVRSAASGEGPLVHDPEAAQLNHDFPDNPDWHFVNFPIGASAYDDHAVFSAPHDVVHLINICIDILEGKPSALALTKSQALRFLIHFVGDVHQPLHVGTGYYRCTASSHAVLISSTAQAQGKCDDRGGNDLKFGSQNLHTFWDADMVSAVVPSADPVVLGAHLAGLVPALPKTPGDYHAWAETWATESIHAAQQAYNHVSFGQESLMSGHIQTILIALPAGYKSAQTPVAEQRLAQAAARLADILNSVAWQVP